MRRGRIKSYTVFGEFPTMLEFSAKNLPEDLVHFLLPQLSLKSNTAFEEERDFSPR